MIRHACLIFVATVAVLVSALLGDAMAARDDDLGGTSFLTPFPVNDVYSVAVVGDEFAEGLLYGLQAAFQGDTRLTIRSRVYPIEGLSRAEFDEQVLRLDEDMKRDPADIVIIMVGARDRAPIRDASGKRIAFGSQPWRQQLASRGDRLLRSSKQKSSAVYWVSLPIVRRADANDDVQAMNDLLRERVYLNGAKFIDAYTGFADESGGYSAYGPDPTGKIRLLREADGASFTQEGYKKLAYFVERDLRSDVNEAKGERNIPLMGDETDQSKINPDKAKLAPEKGSGLPETAKSETPAAPGAAESASGQGEQKADNGKLNLRIVGAAGKDETVALDIVRPAIPASVVALVTRRESADKPSQLGEALIDQIPGGLTVMSTVALATGPSSAAASDRPRVAPSQTPYFRVLFKGERLQPKPGRADDASWPRPTPPSDDAFLKSEAPPVETGTSEPEAAPKPEKAKRPSRRSTQPY